MVTILFEGDKNKSLNSKITLSRQILLVFHFLTFESKLLVIDYVDNSFFLNQLVTNRKKN